METPSPFITDGYTESKYIAEVPGLHPEVRFVYRPALPERRAVVIREAQRAKDPSMSERIIGKAILEHLESWSFKEEITGKRIMQLKPALFHRFTSIIVYGSDPGDKDPVGEAKQEDIDDTLEMSVIESSDERLKEKLGNLPEDLS